MIGLLQRVDGASVEVEGREVARIGAGLLVLVGVERGDDEAIADRLLERLVNYRVFPDSQGRMNLSLTDAGGALLLVPQFTLVADTAKGQRPGFSRAAAPADAERLFGYMAKQAENASRARNRADSAPICGCRSSTTVRSPSGSGYLLTKAREGIGVS